MKEEVKVSIDGSVQELIIRQGEAPKIYDPEKLVFGGMIDAPATFFRTRRANDPNYFDLRKTVVYVDKDERKILLHQNPNDRFADNISGRLYDNPKVVELGLAGGSCSSYRSPAELSNLLRKYIRFFENPDVGRQLVHELKNVKAKVKGEVDKSSDDRGNKANRFEQSVETNIPVSFVLRMPIFQVSEPVLFAVDIFLEVNGPSISCSLDSIQFEEIYEKEIDRILADNVAEFISAGVTVLSS